MKEEIETIDTRVPVGENVLSSLRELWRNKNLSCKTKIIFLEFLFAPILLFRCKTFTLNSKVLKCKLRVRDTCSWEIYLVERANQEVQMRDTNMSIE